MAPAVGSTEMRYSGISLLSRAASDTIALWPAVPTGGVPHLMSLGWACASAAKVVVPSRATAAIIVAMRLNMGIAPKSWRSRLPGRTGRPCHTGWAPTRTRCRREGVRSQKSTANCKMPQTDYSSVQAEAGLPISTVAAPDVLPAWSARQVVQRLAALGQDDRALRKAGAEGE